MAVPEAGTAQPDLAGERLGEQHLLLVASGEMRHRPVERHRLQVQLGRQRAHDLALAAPLQEHPPGEGRQGKRWQRGVLHHMPIQHQAFGPAIGRQVEESAIEHRPRALPGDIGASEQHLAAGDRLDPEAGARHL